MKKSAFLLLIALGLMCFHTGTYAQQTLTPIQFTPISYVKDGKPFYLISGEFHYFRVPKADWKKRMQLFKQAGGNCVATYVPWLIHEPKEGTFDFSTEGIRDLEAFLTLAKEENLYVIVRPGPYQYSELAFDGLPDWLSKNYPQLRAKTFDGKDLKGSTVSYEHPLFLKKTKTWFDKVNPILAKYSVNKGGPVVFLQLDNELTGAHFWNGSIDYNPETMGFGQKDGKYPLFLKKRYGDIATLNKNYETIYNYFEEVRPIEPKSYDKTSEIRRLKDYFDFYFFMCGEYLDTLANMARSNGIDLPFIHNAANPEMVPYFKETVSKLKQPFLLGMDSYYNLDQNWGQNNPTPQYAIREFYGLEMLRLMGFPPTIFELASGSASDWPAMSATDAKACYMLNIAFGMKGHNYYIFTGGPNPMGYGATTDNYDYGAPVGAHNEVRPLYYAQQEVANFLAKECWLVNAKMTHDCRISLDFEYARSGNYWKNKGNFAVSSPDAWDLMAKGVLTTAMLASVSPEFCDLSNAGFMKDQTPLIVVSSSAMSADKQQNLVNYLKQGGKALLLPTVPEFDNNLNPCTILKDFLGDVKLGNSGSAVKRATFGTIQNVRKKNVFVFEKMPKDAEVLGVEENSGKPIACKFKTEGNGTIIIAGINWLASHNEQNQMLVYLLNKLDYKQQVMCDNMNIWHTLRSDGNKQMLFLMNLYTAPQSANIEYLDKSGNLVKLGKVDVEAMSVKPVLLK
jgi:beta-galactosidase